MAFTKFDDDPNKKKRRRRKRGGRGRNKTRPAEMPSPSDPPTPPDADNAAANQAKRPKQPQPAEMPSPEPVSSGKSKKAKPAPMPSPGSGNESKLDLPPDASPASKRAVRQTADEMQRGKSPKKAAEQAVDANREQLDRGQQGQQDLPPDSDLTPTQRQMAGQAMRSGKSPRQAVSQVQQDAQAVQAGEQQDRPEFGTAEYGQWIRDNVSDPQMQEQMLAQNTEAMQEAERQQLDRRQHREQMRDARATPRVNDVKQMNTPGAQRPSGEDLPPDAREQVGTDQFRYPELGQARQRGREADLIPEGGNQYGSEPIDRHGLTPGDYPEGQTYDAQETADRAARSDRISQQQAEIMSGARDESPQQMQQRMLAQLPTEGEFAERAQQIQQRTDLSEQRKAEELGQLADAYQDQQARQMREQSGVQQRVEANRAADARQAARGQGADGQQQRLQELAQMAEEMGIQGSGVDQQGRPTGKLTVGDLERIAGMIGDGQRPAPAGADQGEAGQRGERQPGQQEADLPPTRESPDQQQPDLPPDASDSERAEQQRVRVWRQQDPSDPVRSVERIPPKEHRKDGQYWDSPAGMLRWDAAINEWTPMRWDRQDREWQAMDPNGSKQEQNAYQQWQEQAQSLASESGTTPPQQAIDLLLERPYLADKFNEKYGEGMAERYLIFGNTG